jgi:hypothetical protein
MAWIAIVGSLRTDSWNGKLVAALAARWPEGAAPLGVTGLAGIPVYDGDLEVSAFPPAVTTMQEQIAASDGGDRGDAGVQFRRPGPPQERVRLGPAGGRSGAAGRASGWC